MRIGISDHLLRMGFGGHVRKASVAGRSRPQVLTSAKALSGLLRAARADTWVSP